MNVKSILISVLMLVCFMGRSQTHRFNHLTSADGISQSEVYTFLEDSSGFMWFGTVDGLNKYDGYNIEIFNTNKNNPNSLSNNTIRSLAEDQFGRIWIGTDDGLNLFDPRTELIHQINVKAFEKRTMLLWSILVYDGYLFLGTDNGLWRVNVENENLKDIESGFQQITNYKDSNSSVRSIIKSKGGGIWVLSPEKISRIIFQHKSNEPVEIDEKTFNGFSQAVSAVEDFSGNLWIATTTDGLIKYNTETKQYYHFTKDNTSNSLSSNKCSALAVDKIGNIWVGTLDKGLSFIKSDEVNKETIHFEWIKNEPSRMNSLNSNLIYSLYVSKNNHLWVGTIGAGINIFNPEQKKFEHYQFHDPNGESSNFVRSVYADNQNKVWIGTHNNGLFLFDINNEKFEKLGFETLSVFFIENYEEDKYFICSDGGISIVELVNNKLKILSQSTRMAVFNIIKSKTGIYWCATLNGLVRIKVINDNISIDKIYTTNTTPGISKNNCRVLYYNKNNNQLFVGTEGGGVNIISLDNNQYPEKIQVYKKNNESNSLSNNYVRSIIKDDNENIWIGTYEGLNKLICDSITGKISFKTYTKNDGLPNNMIQLIVEDNSQCLWIGTNGGLSQFLPAEGKFTNYTVNDGLQSNEFSEHTVFKKPDGEIIVGGINGINMFYPEQIEISSLKPQTTITSFYLFNKKISPLGSSGKKSPLEKSIILTDTILLLPKQNNIGFDFSAMIYPNAEEINYAYKLEGFDSGWNYTDAVNRNANYTNLQHGKYTFKVKSTNTDGIWEDSQREIFLHIQTPFRQTWLAYVLYALIIILIFIYFSRFSIIRYTTKKKLLLEKEHNEKLHKLDELRTTFFINISHDLRTPLTLISGPLDNILQNGSLNRDIKEMLLLIKRNVKRLNYLVEQLLDVRKAESGKLSAKLISEDIVSFTKQEAAHFSYAVKNKGLLLKVTSKTDKIMACFDPGMMSKVYFNIISNAIKFTEKGEIEISIERVDKENFKILKKSNFNSFIKVEVQDTGIGISKEQELQIFDRFYQGQKEIGKGYGIGLSHTKELIEAHEGFIEVETMKQVGSTIRFFLPENDITNEGKSIVSSTEDIYINDNIEIDAQTTPENKFANTILVVEDNLDMRNYIAKGLIDSYKVIQASDGVEGLRIAETKIPDLIVSDVMMPNMDGIELCERIKTNIKTSHIPVVLLTAKVDTKTKYEGIETGADDFITKPFEMKFLVLRIKNLLLLRENLRRKFQALPTLEPSSVTVTSIDEKFLSSLIEAVEEGIPDSNFSINSLESKLGMSHANFYRKIKSLTGQSGQELLQNMRMKRAHQILSEKKGLRVAEVAYMVGYTNPKYFSKCFKEMFGFTPSEL